MSKEELEKGKNLAIKLAKRLTPAKDYETIIKKILEAKTLEELGNVVFPGMFPIKENVSKEKEKFWALKRAFLAYKRGQYTEENLLLFFAGFCGYVPKSEDDLRTEN